MLTLNERPSSAALRQRIIDGWVKPRARLMLGYAPEAQSVVFLVAQYWDDNAKFEVHGHLMACADRDPVWPDLMDFDKNPIGDPEMAQEYSDSSPRENAYWAQHEIEYLTTEADLDTDFPKWLGGFPEMVVAFASYCKEGATQNDSVIDAYTPLCVIRREGDDAVSAEVVGEILRPAWEDCWRLIELDEAYDRAGVDRMLDSLGGIVMPGQESPTRR